MIATCCAGTTALVSVSKVFCPVKGRTNQLRASSSSSTALGVDPTKCIALKGNAVKHFFQWGKTIRLVSATSQTHALCPFGTYDNSPPIYGWD